MSLREDFNRDSAAPELGCAADRGPALSPAGLSQGAGPRNYVISPTCDWKPNAAFPSVTGPLHWAVMDENWKRIDHGFAETWAEAREAVAR
jgi:hypothetical protein